MFANLTEETCTGTGNVLTLLGATPGMRPYSRGFDDGALVSYIVKDSAGVITASGIGTYATAANTITRNDFENDDGTVTNKNPATNIALSAGTHTITCDVVTPSVGRLVAGEQTAVSLITSFPINLHDTDPGKGRGADQLSYFGCYYPFPIVIKSLGLYVTTADAAAISTFAGLYENKSDLSAEPGDLIISTGNLDGSVVGEVLETLPNPIYRPPGITWFAAKTDSATMKFTGGGPTDFTNPFGYRRSDVTAMFRAAVTGALPSVAVGLASENNGSVVPCFEYGR